MTIIKLEISSLGVITLYGDNKLIAPTAGPGPVEVMRLKEGNATKPAFTSSLLLETWVTVSHFLYYTHSETHKKSKGSNPHQRRTCVWRHITLRFSYICEVAHLASESVHTATEVTYNYLALFTHCCEVSEWKLHLRYSVWFVLSGPRTVQKGVKRKWQTK